MAGHDKLTKDGEALKKRLEEAIKLQSRVGYQRGDYTYEEEGKPPADITDVAMWNELGTSNMPSRPFMRDSVDKHTDEISSFCKAKFKELVNGQITVQEMYAAIGAYQVGLVQTEITDGEFEPNAPSTIRKKKSDKPLIDTGQMRQSVHYVIKQKGGDNDE